MTEQVETVEHVETSGAGESRDLVESVVVRSGEVVEHVEQRLYAEHRTAEIVESLRVETVEHAVPGPPGAAGAGAGSVEAEKIADGPISGHRAVRPSGELTVVYASSSDPADLEQPVWIALNSAADGAPVVVLMFGEHTEPTWAWMPGEAIYLGPNGTLTQAPPTLAGGAAFLLEIARAVTATRIHMDVKMPIVLA